MIYHATGTMGWMKTIVRLDQGYTYTEFEKNDTIVKSKFNNSAEKLIAIKRNAKTKKKYLGRCVNRLLLNMN